MSTGETPKKPPMGTVGTTEVLHQRRKTPFSYPAMAAGGFIIVAGIAYLTLYHKSKPGTTPSDVARATAGGGAGHNHDGSKPK